MTDDLVARLWALADKKNPFQENSWGEDFWNTDVEPRNQALREAADALAHWGDLRFLYDGAQIDIKRLKAKLADLTLELLEMGVNLSDAREGHETCWKELLETRAKLAGNKAFQCAQACDPAMTEIERLNRETHRLVDRAEKAEAEAAALREALAWYADPTTIAWSKSYPGLGMPKALTVVASEALSQPSPGAALLERVKKLEAVAEAARFMAVDDACNDPSCGKCALTEALAALKENP